MREKIGKMWRTLRGVGSSAVFRLILITLAVVIPLNLLTLVLSNRVLTEAERQISMETENALGIYAAQVDGAIQRMNRALALIVSEDENYRRLSDKAVTDTAEHYRQVQCVVDLRRTLEDQIEQNPMISGAFAWFPEKEMLLLSNLQGESYIFQEALLGVLREDPQAYNKGAFLEAGDRRLLLRMFPYRKGWAGWWIRLETLTGDLSWSGEQIIALTDGTGRVGLSSDPELEKIDLEDTHRVYGGTGYALAQAASREADLVFVQILPKSGLSSSLPTAIWVLQVLAIATLGILPILVLSIRRLIQSPVRKLTRAMGKIESGELDYRIPEGKRDSEFERINRNFNHMMDEVSELKVSVYEEQLKAQKIRMGFLAQQIKPHFILNTLNILYSYEQEEFPLIQRMIMLLSRYFRYTVNADQNFVPLGREMEHLGNYFAIQQTRFVREFRTELRLEEGLEDCLVPPLLIQTFAENAIKHVLEPGRIVEITVSAAMEGPERVAITVADTGGGISDEVLEKIEEFRRTGEFTPALGVGIQNSIDRVRLLYGDEGHIDIGRRTEGGTVVTVHIPYRREEVSEDESDLD